jgi:hypothetical protein
MIKKKELANAGKYTLLIFLYEPSLCANNLTSANAATSSFSFFEIFALKPILTDNLASLSVYNHQIDCGWYVATSSQRRLIPAILSNSVRTE